MRKLVLFATLGAVFAGKYLLLDAFFSKYSGVSYALLIYFAAFYIILIAYPVVLLASLKLVRNRHMLIYSILFSALGYASLYIFLIYGVWILYALSQIFLFSALFLVIFDSSHYEIRKYPAFGFGFAIVYSLAETTGLAQGNIDPFVMALYLTLSLIIFIAGTVKIRDDANVLIKIGNKKTQGAGA